MELKGNLLPNASEQCLGFEGLSSREAPAPGSRLAVWLGGCVWELSALEGRAAGPRSSACRSVCAGGLGVAQVGYESAVLYWQFTCGRVPWLCFVWQGGGWSFTRPEELRFTNLELQQGCHLRSLKGEAEALRKVFM